MFSQTSLCLYGCIANSVSDSDTVFLFSLLTATHTLSLILFFSLSLARLPPHTLSHTHTLPNDPPSPRYDIFWFFCDVSPQDTVRDATFHWRGLEAEGSAGSGGSGGSGGSSSAAARPIRGDFHKLNEDQQSRVMRGADWPPLVVRRR